MGAIAMKGAAPRLLTIKQAAERLNNSTASVLRLINESHLRAFDVSAGRSGRRTLRISEDEITRFLGDHATYQPAVAGGGR